MNTYEKNTAADTDTWCSTQARGCQHCIGAGLERSMMATAQAAGLCAACLSDVIVPHGCLAAGTAVRQVGGRVARGC